MAETQPKTRFQRCIILCNPVSTHAAAAQRRIRELQRIFGSDAVEVIETSEKGEAANRRLLIRQGDKLGPNTLLGIAAGDGTTNLIIETLLTSEELSDTARKTPILPLWGGNANDLAHMLNGAAYRASLKEIVAHGSIIPIHPLRFEMKPKHSKRAKTRIAACYAGFGATAVAAHRLNDSSHRRSKLHSIPGGRLILEAVTVIGAMLASPVFSVKESNRVKVVYELTFLNGSRMAKLERTPTKLTDEMFYINTFENKKLLSIIPKVFEAYHKRISRKLLRNYASFTVQEASWAQFDGEPMQIAAHTKVQAELSRTPFLALSTVLKQTGKK